MGFLGNSVAKNLPGNAGDTGDMGSVSESGRSPGRGHGNPLQYSCLEDPMDRGAWQATVHKVTNCQTRLRQLSMYAQCSLKKTCLGTHVRIKDFKI